MKSLKFKKIKYTTGFFSVDQNYNTIKGYQHRKKTATCATF
jgi:hypothetical protein